VRQIRRAVEADVPSIIMTGDTSQREISAAGLPNCTVVHKPVDPDRLLTLVQSMLS
jgi:DNA-binding NtrC family response regulator